MNRTLARLSRLAADPAMASDARPLDAFVTGKKIGTIKFPEQPANATSGGKDMKTLYVTARTSVYSVPMAVAGHRYPGK
jgi:methylglyoxal synthase